MPSQRCIPDPGPLFTTAHSIRAAPAPLGRIQPDKVADHVTIRPSTSANTSRTYA